MVLVAAAATLELTEVMIIMAMTKADARVCAGTDRCYAFPDRLADARQTCTPKWWCKPATFMVRLSIGEQRTWLPGQGIAAR